MPPSDQKLLKTLRETMYKALKAKSVEFEDDLIYDGAINSSQNDTKLEPELQKLESTDRETYYKMKELTNQGLYAPMEVINDLIQGFMMRSAAIIPEFTLLCEYTGQVRS
jgi:hypothetical protein